MKHTIVTFQLHRTAVILIAIGGILVAVLLVAFGYLAGTSARVTPSPAVQKPAEPPKPAEKPPENQEAVALRVGLATTEEDAKQQLQILAMKKLAATIVPIETSNATTIYELHYGHYADRRVAMTAAEELQKNFGVTAAVVPERATPAAK